MRLFAEMEEQPTKHRGTKTANSSTTTTFHACCTFVATKYNGPNHEDTWEIINSAISRHKGSDKRDHEVVGTAPGAGSN